MTTTPAPSEQREVAVQFAYVVAQSWSKTFTAPELLHFNNLRDRLEGVAHSVFVELSGDGGIDVFRLTPKAHPELDLLDLDWLLRHAYSLRQVDDPDGPEPALDLLRAIHRCQLARQHAAAELGGVLPVESVHRFLAGICRIIEDGYLLVPLHFADNGQFESEGQDIAPGLTVAFETVWAETNR